MLRQMISCAISGGIHVTIRLPGRPRPERSQLPAADAPEPPCARGLCLPRPHRDHPRPDEDELPRLLRPLPQAGLGAGKARDRPGRHRVGDAVEHAGDAGGPSRRADGRRRAPLAQHPPGRQGRRLPARAFRIEAADRRPRVLRRRRRGPRADVGEAPDRRLRRPRISRGRPGREGRADRCRGLRGARRGRRPGLRLGAAGRRMGRDLPQLHIRHHGESERRRLPSPRRRADGLRQRHRVRHGAPSGLPVDPADVPLQRLVLPLDARRRRRDARMPAMGPREGHVRRHRRPWRDAPVRGADRHVGAPQRSRRRKAQFPPDRDLQHRRRPAAGLRPRRHGRRRLRGGAPLWPDRDLRSGRGQRMA